MDKFLLYPGADRITGTLLLMSGTVLLYLLPFQESITQSKNVVHRVSSGVLYFLLISFAKCCGFRSLIDRSVTRYVPGKSNLCVC
jgi:uncharacterized membrane protein SirB2